MPATTSSASASVISLNSVPASTGNARAVIWVLRLGHVSPSEEVGLSLGPSQQTDVGDVAGDQAISEGFPNERLESRDSPCRPAADPEERWLPRQAPSAHRW